MSSRALILPVLLSAMSLAACERKALSTASTPPEISASPDEKARTHESGALAKAVDAYAHAQNPENDAAVRKAMADVDAELLELEDLVAKRHGREREKVGAKFRRLEVYRSEQTTRFAEAQAGPGLTIPEPRRPAEAERHSKDVGKNPAVP